MPISIPMPQDMNLDLALANKMAKIALGHVTREFPNKLDHVMTGCADVSSPRELHPIFFGSFDWHSCVHGYWLLARLYRRFPQFEQAPSIRTFFESNFTAPNIAAEIEYLDRPSSRGFERPYGWAWAVMLCAELMQHPSPEGQSWANAMRLFGKAFAAKFKSFLPTSNYPVRAGVHSNTAFALILLWDFAATAADTELMELIRKKALEWYAADVNCQAWEPSQDEFLSPALIEANLMSSVLAPSDFTRWFTRFLPGAENKVPMTLFQPAHVSDRTDGKIAHLDGLNLSRAWCWRRIARALPTGSPTGAIAQHTAREHIASALPQIAGDYMGEHWLASFALLALDPWPDKALQFT